MIETKKFDAADYLDTPEAIAAYLEAVFEEGDAELIKAALSDIARSRGMTEMAKATGISRRGLYKALSSEGDPKLSTLLSIFKAFGLRVSMKAA